MDETSVFLPRHENIPHFLVDEMVISPPSRVSKIT